MGREIIFNNEFERLYNYDGELGVVYSNEKVSLFYGHQQQRKLT